MDLFKEIFGVHSDNGQKLARSLLHRNGYDVRHDTTWCYGAGTVPLLLVAHTDTVFSRPPATIYHDRKKHVLYGDNGIGADDRAGVWAIATLLEQGYRPHVLFTDLEELGGYGATDASWDLPQPRVHAMIQLDRRGADDAVYYCSDNRKFQRWVTRNGFITAQGTFTDISILMPAWDLAGVNLSVGYYDEHTHDECLFLDEWEHTLRRVRNMLASPPGRVMRANCRKRFAF